MNKTPKEILLEQHRAAGAKLDRVREDVLAAELDSAKNRAAAIVAQHDPVLRQSHATFWQFLWRPGFAAIVLVAAAGFAAGWGMRANTPGGPVASTAHSAQNNSPRTASAAAASGKTFAQILAEPGGFQRNRDLEQFTAALSAAQVKSLLEQLDKNPRKGEYYEGRMALLGRFVEVDPAGALAWAQSLDKSTERNDALSNLFNLWGANDPKPLFDIVARTTNLEQRRELQQTLVNTLAEQNPAAALGYLNTLSAGQRQPYLYSQIFQQWSQSDPQAALAEADKLPPGETRNQALQGLAQGWSQSDPQAALAWAQTLPSGSARNNAMSNILNQLASQDPQAALKLLDDLPNNNLRSSMIYNVANSWAQSDPAAALAWVQATGIPPAIQQNIVPNILNQLAQTDPAAAMKYVDGLSAGPVRQNAVTSVVSEWAQQDPQSALAWATNQTDLNANTRRNVFGDIINQWALGDPMDAATYLEQHLDDRAMSGALVNVASQWAQSDPAAALQWANSLPDSANKTNAMANILSQQASQDPQAVWDYLQQNSADLTNNRVQGVMQQVINAWAQEDPAKAAAVVATIPDGSQSRQAYSTLANEWLNQDPGAASQWMTTLPAGTARDAAVSQLVSSQSIYEPDTTFAWALTIDDPRTRQNALRTAATELYRADPQQAQQIIAASGLPDDQAATLLQQAQNSVNNGRGGIIRGGPGGIMLKAGPNVMMAPAAVMPEPAAAAPMDAGSGPAEGGTMDGAASSADASSPIMPSAPVPTATMAMAPAAPAGPARIGKPLLVPPPKTVKPAAQPAASVNAAGSAATDNSASSASTDPAKGKFYVSPF